MLVFPGLFKGLLEARIPKVEKKHKLAAANYLKNPTRDEILPSALDKQVATVIADAIKAVA